MKRTAHRIRKVPANPVYLAARAPWDHLAKSFEDDFDEDLVDYDDERETVDLVLLDTAHGQPPH